MVPTGEQWGIEGAVLTGRVVAVAQDGAHRFSKAPSDAIMLVAGMGVAGDAHAGATVQHLSRVAKDPSQPNLRQVHLMAAELLDEMAAQGFPATPGALGENVTVRGLPLIDLPEGTVLMLGSTARVRVTGLRNPCAQIDRWHPGALGAVLDRTPDGTLIRKAGIMAVVEQGGTVTAGDAVTVELPPTPWRRLAVV